MNRSNLLSSPSVRRFVLAALLLSFSFPGIAQEPLDLPDEIPMPKVEIGSVVKIPEGWREMAKEVRSVTVAPPGRKTTVTFNIMPGVLVHEDMISVGAQQTLDATLEMGLYPTAIKVTEVHGVRSILVEGVRKDGPLRFWMRTYLIPAKEAPYYVIISRQPGEQWPEIEKILVLEDVESPFAKSFMDGAEEETAELLKVLQETIRRKPGFKEPDLTD